MPSASPGFRRYLGIDHSGAGTPESSLPGLRLYQATPGEPDPVKILPPEGRRQYGSRCGLAHFLCKALAQPVPTAVSIDHALSFPLIYFQHHRWPLQWDPFLPPALNAAQSTTAQFEGWIRGIRPS